MSWFTPKRKERPQRLHVQQTVFLGEQSGEIEEELKRRLIELFQIDQSIVAAYLARVSYKDKLPPSVTLCLRTQPESQVGVAAQIGNVFGSMFSSKEHMDIIFLDREQEFNVSKVCSPFFQREVAGADGRSRGSRTGSGLNFLIFFGSR